MRTWSSLVRLLRRRPAVSWFAVAGLIALCAAGLPRLQTDLGLRAFLSTDAAIQDAVERSDATWGRDDQVFAVLLTAPEGDLLTAERLADIDRTRRALLALPEVVDAVDLTTLPLLQRTPSILAPSPTQVVAQDLLTSIPDADGPRFQAWRRKMSTDPLRVPSLLSANGAHAAILLTLDASIDQPKELSAAVAAVVAAVPDTGLEVATTGGPVLRNELRAALAEDQARLIPLVGLLLAGVLAVTLGRFRAVVFPLVLAGISVVCTLGVLGWLGHPIGYLSMAWMILLPVVAVSDAVHLQRRLALEESPRAFERSMGSVGTACVVTTLTSAVGIGSLVVSPMLAVQQFATDGAIGLMVTLVLFVLLGPLVAAPSAGGRVELVLTGLSGGCARFAVQHRALVVGSAVAAGLAGLWLGSGVKADYRLVDNLAVGRPIVAATRLADRQLGGSMLLSFELEGGALKPGAVRALATARDELVEPGESWNLPSNVAEAWIRTVTDDWMGRDDWLGHALERAPRDATVLDAAGRGRLVVRTSDRGAASLVDRAHALEAALNERLASEKVEVRASGTALHAYRGVLQLPRDLVAGLSLATLAIALLIGLLLRSARLALLSLLPNVLPLALTLGLQALLGWPLQLGTAVVFTLGLGLAVDDTIHVMARWQEREVGGHDAIVAAARDSGTAVVITSTALLAGVFVLLFSNFRGMVEFGVLGASLIASALLADLLVVPALLTFTREARR